MLPCVGAWSAQHLLGGRRGHLILPLPPCAQHVLSRAQSIAVSDLCNVLLAFARLNFRPEQEDAFFDLVRLPPRPGPSLPADGKEGCFAGAGGGASQLEPDLPGVVWGQHSKPQHSPVCRAAAGPEGVVGRAPFPLPP